MRSSLKEFFSRSNSYLFRLPFGISTMISNRSRPPIGLNDDGQADDGEDDEDDEENIPRREIAAARVRGRDGVRPADQELGGRGDVLDRGFLGRRGERRQHHDQQQDASDLDPFLHGSLSFF